MDHRKLNREIVYIHICIHICLQKIAVVILLIKEIEAMNLERE